MSAINPSSPPLATEEGVAEPWETMFLDSLPLIKRLCAHVARRYRLAWEDQEDFHADVRLKLVHRNYQALRRFEGHCKLESYLFMLVNRMFWEWRNQLKGRWRPSTEATRQGPLAVKLEELIYREGRPMAEARNTLICHYGASEAQIDRLLTLLPKRIRREIVSVEGMDDMACPTEDVERALLDREREALGHRLQAAIQQSLARLSEEDQLILKLSFRENIKTVAIARTMGYPVKKLYRRIEKLLRVLRKDLERAGYGHRNREEWFQSVKLAALSTFGPEAPTSSSREEGNHDG